MGEEQVLQICNVLSYIPPMIRSQKNSIIRGNVLLNKITSHSNKKIIHLIFIWKIKIKCFLYTIQKKKKTVVMYDTKKYNSQYFYIGSWIYKTILHKNFFFFYLQYMLIRVWATCTVTNRRPDYSGLLREQTRILPLWRLLV